MKRFLAVFTAFLLATNMMGCAQGPSSGPGWTLLSNGLGGPVEAADMGQTADQAGDLHAPTIANKTLSAMALERATGLKPVPSRLVKFD